MILTLGGIFGIRLNQTTAEASLASATATMVGRGISQLLIGWIPLIGNATNAITAFSITETIGWVVCSDFDNRSKQPKFSEKKNNKNN
jgi:uncharacterized protein (DUF697 family)